MPHPSPRMARVYNPQVTSQVILQLQLPKSLNFCQLPVVVSCWTSRGLKLGHCATSDGCVACNTSHPYVEVGHLNKVPFANHHETIPPFAAKILHCLRGRGCRTHLMTFLWHQWLNLLKGEFDYTAAVSRLPNSGSKGSHIYIHLSNLGSKGQGVLTSFEQETSKPWSIAQ